MERLLEEDDDMPVHTEVAAPADTSTGVADSHSPSSDQAQASVPSTLHHEQDTHDMFDISIVEFFPRGDLLTYKICTKTDLQDQEPKEAVVERSFYDFEWLGDRLAESSDLVGVVIPRVPSKAVFWPATDEELKAAKVQQGIGLAASSIGPYQHRAAQLERYLRRLALVPEVRKNVHLLTFLTSQDPLPTVKKSWLDGFKIPKSFKTEDKHLGNTRQYYLNYLSKLERTLKRGVRRSRSQTALAHQIVHVQSAISAAGEEGVLPDGYAKAISTAMADEADCLSRSVLSSETALLQLLSDAADVAHGVDSAAFGVAELEQEAIDAMKRRHKIAESGKSTDAMTNEQENELSRAERMEDATQQAFEQALGTFNDHIKFQRSLRISEMKQAIVTLAVSEIELATRQHQAWAAALHELRRVESEGADPEK